MTANQQPLLQLTYIRFVVICAQTCALTFAILYLHLPISPWFSGSALLLLAFLNLVTYARLHSAFPVTSLELFSQLLADCIIYGFLLYHTGGGTNPFVSMLLIPLIIAVMTLENRYIWIIGILVSLMYGILLRDYVPITPMFGHQHGVTDYLDIHMVGMWINFLMTAIVITYFITHLNRSLQAQQKALIESRETAIHNQQLLSLATIAAGTAHELGTPLGTMRVLLHEMSNDPRLDTEQQEDLDLLQQQVQVCAGKLKEMARSVEEEQSSEHTTLATEFMQDIIEQWKITRPEVTFTLNVKADLPPDLRSTTALRQAILNLLNNAADANPQGIRISLTWDKDDVFIRIRDFGPGLPIEQADQLGKPFITTKGGGLGIGLFLTSSTIASYDGDVQLYNAEDSGTITEVRLSRRAVHG